MLKKNLFAPYMRIQVQWKVIYILGENNFLYILI